jgi:hypothetical protein
VTMPKMGTLWEPSAREEIVLNKPSLREGNAPSSYSLRTNVNWCSRSPLQGWILGKTPRYLLPPDRESAASLFTSVIVYHSKLKG